MSEFSIGDEVRMVGDPTRIGTVVAIGNRRGGIQWYEVYWGGVDGKTEVPDQSLCRYVRCSTLPPGGWSDFQRTLTYERLLRDRPLQNNIYAFNASRTRFYPYQFRPLLVFLDSTKRRLLIADEVGLGKTIEAGLILTELRARETVSRVLVVCPSNLRDKWKLELKRRFDEEFMILNTPSMKAWLRDFGELGERKNLAGIVSLETLRQQQILDLAGEVLPSIDLVIVDEAHHMRNKATLSNQAGLLFSQLADSMLLLTATPVHLSDENLHNLLNVLDEDDFPDAQTSHEKFIANSGIIRTKSLLACFPPRLSEARDLLEQASKVEWFSQNQLLASVLARVTEMSHNSGSLDRQERLELLRDLEHISLTGHVLTRTRKREVQAAAVRRPFAIMVEFSRQEQAFYDAVTRYVRAKALREVGSPVVRKWIENTPQRRMASCIPAMVEAYRNSAVNAGFTEDEKASAFDLHGEQSSYLQESEFSQAEAALLRIVSAWDSSAADSKYSAFVQALREIRKAEGQIKAVVFAFFKGTLRYLERRLRADGFAVVLISGDIEQQERLRRIENFHDENGPSILLSSRVGSEGLDLQVASVLFNYDLPWNPMEVEQRIGRLDRIGQLSPTIRIYNFWIKGTIEERILRVLYDRIRIFEESVGDLEGILGEIISRLEGELLSGDLTPEEEEHKRRLAVYAIDKQVFQIQELEREAAKFIGTGEFFDEQVQLTKSNRRYITGPQIQHLIRDFLLRFAPKTRLEAIAGKPHVFRLYPDQDLQEILRKSTDYGILSTLATSGATGIEITFESESAFKYPRVEMINILHPLVRLVLQHYRSDQSLLIRCCFLSTRTRLLAPGFYYFFLYVVSIHSARTTHRLEMAVLDRDFVERLDPLGSEQLMGEMLEDGSNLLLSPEQELLDGLTQAQWYAKSLIEARVTRIHTEETEDNEYFLQRRTASVRSSYEKKLKVIRSQLERARAEGSRANYIRMLEGRLRNVTEELQARLTEFESMRSVGVDYHGAMEGILEVHPERASEAREGTEPESLGEAGGTGFDRSQA